MTRSFGLFVRDNLEAFAVAIAMALVIRHYCIEAFRIPTGSMMPTLYGDEPASGRHGDRILVDKFAYLRRDPRRYEVAVFQYPLNRNRNYIKRIVGLPGEWLRVADGDIWVSHDEGATWELTRKPPGAREQLFFPYYPDPPDDARGFRGQDAWESDDGWTVDEKASRFAVDAGPKPERLRFARKVLPYDAVDGYGAAPPPHVGDVRVSFRADVERAGSLVVLIEEWGRVHRLQLSASGSFAEIGGDAPARHDLDVRFEGEQDVSFANVDDTLVVEIDGEQWEFPFPDTPTAPPDRVVEFNEGVDRNHSIAIEATGVKAVLTDLRIDRDIYYFGSSSGGDGWSHSYWPVPDDSYMMFGDNTRSSHDSREWQVVSVKLADGTRIEWDVNNREGVINPDPDDADENGVVTVVADVDGLVRRYRLEDKEDDDRVPRPYVSRDHLIGRAFAVFWPIYLPPAYRGATRVRIIR